MYLYNSLFSTAETPTQEIEEKDKEKDKKVSTPKPLKIMVRHSEFFFCNHNNEATN